MKCAMGAPACSSSTPVSFFICLVYHQTFAQHCNIGSYHYFLNSYYERSFSVTSPSCPPSLLHFAFPLCAARGRVPIHHCAPAVFMLCCRVPLALSSLVSSASPYASSLWVWRQNRGIQMFEAAGGPTKTLSSSSGPASYMSITTLAQVKKKSIQTQITHGIVEHGY